MARTSTLTCLIFECIMGLFVSNRHQFIIDFVKSMTAVRASNIRLRDFLHPFQVTATVVGFNCQHGWFVRSCVYILPMLLPVSSLSMLPNGLGARIYHWAKWFWQALNQQLRTTLPHLYPVNLPPMGLLWPHPSPIVKRMARRITVASYPRLIDQCVCCLSHCFFFLL